MSRRPSPRVAEILNDLDEHRANVARTAEHRCARDYDVFTVERVASLIDDAAGTVDRRALGAVMLAASRKGWIAAQGWTPGGASRHGRPVRVWASRLRRAAP